MLRLNSELPKSTTRLSAAEYLRLCASHAPSKPSRRNKYGNRPTRDGFDSVHERAVYQQLSLQRDAMDPADRVIGIERQVRFELIPKQATERAVFYVADFVVTFADQRQVVIDAKSSITRKNRAYVLKRKLMLLVHGVTIDER